MLHMSVMHSYLLLGIVSFDGCTTICLSTLHLRDIWIISSLRQLQIQKL